MKILGIDPGTGRMGFAILEKEKGKEVLLDVGCLETKTNSPLPERLLKIYEFLDKLIKKYNPDQAAVEELFFATNAKTAMSVGAARGVILLACAKHKIAVTDYSPVKIKLAVAGYGKADKKQVEYMVCQILKLKEIPKPDDAVDAVAVALTHINCVKF
jgi:crossover junction endodeoxyribonuclease RuvC